MTETKRTASDRLLNDILDEYAAAGPSRDELERWIREYPQFQRELTELTVSWLELKHLRPIAAKTDPVDAQLRAASILGEVLHTLRNASPHVTPVPESKEAPVSPASSSLESMLEQATKRGLDVEQLARAVRMSVAMIMSLHRRVVEATSVPREALLTLGGVLQLAPDALYSYLNAPPKLAIQQQFKSKQAPIITSKIDFAKLVKDDPELSELDRAYWLSLQISSTDTPAK